MRSAENRDDSFNYKILSPRGHAPCSFMTRSTREFARVLTETMRSLHECVGAWYASWGVQLNPLGQIVLGAYPLGSNHTHRHMLCILQVSEAHVVSLTNEV